MYDEVDGEVDGHEGGDANMGDVDPRAFQFADGTRPTGAYPRGPRRAADADAAGERAEEAVEEGGVDETFYSDAFRAEDLSRLDAHDRDTHTAGAAAAAATRRPAAAAAPHRRPAPAPGAASASVSPGCADRASAALLIADRFLAGPLGRQVRRAHCSSTAVVPHPQLTRPSLT